MSRVRIKVCGLTREIDVEMACAAGVDAVGFVLAPSPRRVSADACRRLMALVPAGIERVAVLGPAGPDDLRGALDLGFDLLQAECDATLAPEVERRLIPVLRDGPDLLERLERFPLAASAPASLGGALTLDGPLGGGRGLTVDLERARSAAKRRWIVLAGGLTPGNVSARIRHVRPFAVDASSGLEHWPGIKTKALVEAFVQAVREAESDLTPLPLQP